MVVCLGVTFAGKSGIGGFDEKSKSIKIDKFSVK